MEKKKLLEITEMGDGIAAEVFCDCRTPMRGVTLMSSLLTLMETNPFVGAAVEAAIHVRHHAPDVVKKLMEGKVDVGDGTMTSALMEMMANAKAKKSNS